MAAEPGELLAQRGAGVERRAARAAARARRAGPRARRAPRRRSGGAPRRSAPCSEPSTSETPNSRWITRSWISRARSMRAWSRRARPCWLVAMRTLAASAAVLPSVHRAWRSAVGQLEAGAAAVGEDHAEPAPGGGHRHAAERLDAADAPRSARAPSARGRRSPPPRGPRTAPPGRSGVSSSVPYSSASRPASRPWPPTDDHELARVVVEQQAGALHRAEPAAGLAQPVVELAPRSGGAPSSAPSSSTITSSASVRGERASAMSFSTFPRGVGLPVRERQTQRLLGGQRHLAHVSAALGSCTRPCRRSRPLAATTRRRPTGTRGRRARPRRATGRRPRGRLRARASRPSPLPSRVSVSGTTTEAR